VTATVVVAVFVGSTTDAAVIVAVPAPTAVTNPVADTLATVLALELQLTAVLVDPATAADNWCVWPTFSDSDDGETATEMAGGAGTLPPPPVFPGPAGAESPPQPAAMRRKLQATRRTLDRLNILLAFGDNKRDNSKISNQK
jgi:hypothetical protein